MGLEEMKKYLINSALLIILAIMLNTGFIYAESNEEIEKIGFNFVENNPFLDLRVRKAIYHAINIDEIIDNALDGYAEPASQFVSNYIFGYNPQIKRLSYDLEKAQQYMEDAGYENGFDIILDCRGSELRENASRIIADQLSLINITVEVNILRRSDFF